VKYILAVLADWANGLFALVAAQVLTGTALEWWYIPIALLLSHLPDVDAVPGLVKFGNVAVSAKEEGRDHRSLLHYPVLAVPVCVLAALYGGFWGLVVAIVVPLHLLNDLYGTGWGLQLLWPLQRSHYKLLSRRVNRLHSMFSEEEFSQLPTGETRLRGIVTWSEKELPAYIRRYGMDDWIESWYLQLNRVSAVEYTLFLVACILTVVQMSQMI